MFYLYKSSISHGKQLPSLGWYYKFVLVTTGLAREIGYGTADPALATSIESLAHCQAADSYNVLKVLLWNCPSELAELVPFRIILGGLLIILIRYLNFLPPFLDILTMFMSTVPFLVHLNPGIFCLENSFLSIMI